MCWGVPARVKEIKEFTALVDFGGGSIREVVLAAKGIREGDLVMVHAGAIIGKVSEEEIISSLELYKEMAMDLAKSGGGSGEELKEIEEYIERYKKLLGLSGGER